MSATIVALFNFVVNLVLTNHYSPNISIHKLFSKNLIITFLIFFLPHFICFLINNHIFLSILSSLLNCFSYRKEESDRYEKRVLLVDFLTFNVLICDSVSFFIKKAVSLSSIVPNPLDLILLSTDD